MECQSQERLSAVDACLAAGTKGEIADHLERMAPDRSGMIDLLIGPRLPATLRT
jgi:hypothetical protein